MRLTIHPSGWKREFLRPDGAVQIGKALIDNGYDRSVEIWLRLPERHHIMMHGWQERARQAAERKLMADPLRNGSVISLELWEIAAD